MEASAREVEVLVARERDGYYEQLMQSLGSQTTPSSHPPPRETTPSLPAVPAVAIGNPISLL
eukprot:350512-Amphidinium_carterae.1